MAPHDAAADLELSLSGRAADGTPVRRRDGLDLDGPDQRSLAARLAGQRQVVVLSADDAGGWPASFGRQLTRTVPLT